MLTCPFKKDKMRKASAERVCDAAFPDFRIISLPSQRRKSVALTMEKAVDTV